MVLVDTSIWIRSFRSLAPYADELDRLLSRDEVAGHDLVLGELLIGDRGARASRLSGYERIWRAGSVPHAEVVAFVRERKLPGRGLGWIDVHLLASALVGRLRFWTADAPLIAAASDLGIAYSAPRPS